MNNLKFETIYNENSKTILNRIIYKIGQQNKEIAEEMMQDIFVSVAKHLKDFDPSKSALTTWLITITNNKIIDYYRSKKDTAIKISDYQNEHGIETVEFKSYERTDNLVNSKFVNEQIYLAFEKLNPTLKEVANLYFLEGYKYSEIVAELNIPLNSVKAYINRIRGVLQENLSHVKEYA